MISYLSSVTHTCKVPDVRCNFALLGTIASLGAFASVAVFSAICLALALSLLGISTLSRRSVKTGLLRFTLLASSWKCTAGFLPGRPCSSKPFCHDLELDELPCLAEVLDSCRCNVLFVPLVSKWEIGNMRCPDTAGYSCRTVVCGPGTILTSGPR